MTQLVAPFTDWPILGQDAVHRARRAQVAPLVEERGPHGARRQVAETVVIEDVQHGLAFGGRERPRRGRTGLLRPGARACRPAPVERGSRDTERAAGRSDADASSQILRCAHESFPLFGIVKPSSRETFPCTSMIVSAVSRRWRSRAFSRSS